jgi:hypothetical protein
VTSGFDTETSFRRPELQVLSDGERRRVAARARARGTRCDACRHAGFDVGDALYLGFLFMAAEQDEYMVALTCRNPRCPAPRTGIRLRAGEFRDDPDPPPGG